MISAIAGFFAKLMGFLKDILLWGMEKAYNIFIDLLQHLLDLLEEVLEFLLSLLPSTPDNILLGLRPPAAMIEYSQMINVWLPLDSAVVCIGAILTTYVFILVAKPVSKFIHMKTS